MRIRGGVSKEEKVAQRIGKEMWDLELDLEMVGSYLGRSLPYLIFNRTLVVLESAQASKEEIINRREGHLNDPFF